MTVLPSDAVTTPAPVESDEVVTELTPAAEVTSSPQSDTTEAGLPGETARIASIATFDPEGDFEENDNLAPDALADGDSSTS